jgi:hypothetical protein
VTKMETYTLKEGNGLLRGVSNDLAQAGKTLYIYDGDIMRFTTPLDEAFPDNKETGKPGKVLDIIITRSLRVETDGGGLNFYWR